MCGGQETTKELDSGIEIKLSMGASWRFICMTCLQIS